MRCFVASCKNDTRHISKSHGITFHAIPTERNLRKAWLKAIGKEAWTPKERCTICSDHFLTEDLYVTKNGLRKVRNGAVPVIMQNEPSSKHDGDDNLNVCRICLAIDNKVFPITKYRLEMAYESLTGISATEDNLPKKLCMECAQRLQNSTKFKKKCLQAYSLLMDVAASLHSGQLTLQSIKNLDRYENQLHSCLKIKKFEPDHYDYNIEYKENLNTEVNVTDFKDDEIKLEDQYAIPVLDLVKDETENNEIFLNETDDFDDNKDLVDDDNYVASDKDYSTDDSLPLERRRTKKEKVKKKAKAVKEVKRKPGRKAIEKATEPKIDRRRKPFLNNDLNDILFTITDLTLEEQIADIQKRQESANFKNSVFKCMECYKGFLDEDAYNSHMSRHTDQCGEYACAICKTHFKHSHALRKHITAHHSQRFCCNQCPYVTTHRQTARLHERWHKGTKYKCPHCEDEFVKFTTYMGHIRIKHPSDFVCELCGYSFVSEKGIELHKKLKHRMDDVQIPPDAPYCEQCNVRFISEEAYRRHLSVSARHNADDKDKKANVSKLNRKPRQMRDRMKEKEEDSELDRKMYPSQMRKAEGPIPCEQCGLQLEDSRAYHGHFRRMHPDKNRTNYPSMKSPCMCEVCGRMFQSFALLRDHTWTHTGERPFKCDSCDKCFRMKQRLVAHRRVHSQMKATYACAHCGKHFSTHSNRQRHMFIHTGLKPFKCEMCGKCFKHASEKRAHINYVHLKKPWPKRTRGKRRDGRTGPLPLNQGMGGSEMDIVQPIWPCDQKLDMNMMDDKPMYYNLKI